MIPQFSQEIPLSLYIHIPWCVRKCPYCDFNSHQADDNLAEKAYIDALILDLEQELPKTAGRPLQSIFIGGGTPSLFSTASIEDLITRVNQHISFVNNIEITLEANPGTFESEKFKAFASAGINRLSIGVQSFQNDKLKALGRVHDADQAKRAIETADNAGFSSFNLDIMHGLPQQSIDDALSDLQTAIDMQAPHISWYQLTIEPNTVFYKRPPELPHEDTRLTIEEHGKQLLQHAGFSQYEVSAYAKTNHQCRHNLNYWQFGDYIGIGAGAHGKITDQHCVLRNNKHRQPKDYLNPEKNFIADEKKLSPDDLRFEFMLNALRLEQKIDLDLYYQRTGLSIDTIKESLDIAQKNKFLECDAKAIQLTKSGRLFLNDVVMLFLS